jgi:hypothetical protein
VIWAGDHVNDPHQNAGVDQLGRGHDDVCSMYLDIFLMNIWSSTSMKVLSATATTIAAQAPCHELPLEITYRTGSR